MTDAAPLPPQPVLSSLRVLLTRPIEQSEETAEWLFRSQACPLVVPCLRIEPVIDPALTVALAERSRYAAIALTSVWAVRSLLSHTQPDSSWPPLCVVGEKTALALRRHGIEPALIAESSSAHALALQILSLIRPERAALRVLFPQAAEGRDELLTVLHDAGVAVDRVTAYRTVEASREQLQPAVVALRQATIDLLPLGSPKSAQVLLRALGDDARDVLAQTLVGAIGQTTAQALRDAGIRVDVVASKPSFEVLMKELAERKVRG